MKRKGFTLDGVLKLARKAGGHELRPLWSKASKVLVTPPRLSKLAETICPSMYSMLNVVPFTGARRRPRSPNMTICGASNRASRMSPRSLERCKRSPAPPTPPTSSGYRVSAGLFPLTCVEMRLSRNFHADEDRSGVRALRDPQPRRIVATLRRPYRDPGAVSSGSMAPLTR